jgi:hypothetical protein
MRAPWFQGARFCLEGGRGLRLADAAVEDRSVVRSWRLTGA